MFKKKISPTDVQYIVDRWEHITVPEFIQDRMKTNAEKLALPQLETISTAERSGKIEENLLKTAFDTIFVNTYRASREGMYLGIHLLTGNLKRKRINEYIDVITKPSEDFIVQWTGVLYVVHGVITKEEGERLVKHVAWQGVQTVNDNLILVIDYAEAFLDCNPRLKFKKNIR